MQNESIDPVNNATDDDSTEAVAHGQREPVRQSEVSLDVLCQDFGSALHSQALLGIQPNFQIVEVQLSFCDTTIPDLSPSVVQNCLERCFDEIGGVLQYMTKYDVDRLASKALSGQVVDLAQEAFINSLTANGALLIALEGQSCPLPNDLHTTTALFQKACNSLIACRHEQQTVHHLQALLSMIDLASKCCAKMLPSLISEMIRSIDLIGFELYRPPNFCGDLFEKDEEICRVFWSFCCTETVWKVLRGRNTALLHLIIQEQPQIQSGEQKAKFDQVGWHVAMCGLQRISSALHRTLYGRSPPENVASSVDGLFVALADWKTRLPMTYRDLDSAVPEYLSADRKDRRSGLRLTCVYFGLAFAIQRRALELGLPPDGATGGDIGLPLFRDPCSAAHVLRWISSLEVSELILDQSILELALTVTCKLLSASPKPDQARQHLSSLANAHMIFSRISHMLKQPPHVILRTIESAQRAVR